MRDKANIDGALAHCSDLEACRSLEEFEIALKRINKEVNDFQINDDQHDSSRMRSIISWVIISKKTMLRNRQRDQEQGC